VLSDFTCISPLAELFVVNRAKLTDFLLCFFSEQNSDFQHSLFLKIAASLLDLPPNTSLAVPEVVECQKRLIEAVVLLLSEREPQESVFEKGVIDVLAVFPKNPFLSESHADFFVVRMFDALRRAPSLAWEAINALKRISISPAVCLWALRSYQTMEFLSLYENRRSHSLLLEILFPAAWKSELISELFEALQQRLASNDFHGLVLDLIGIFKAADNGRKFSMLFQWLHACFDELFLQFVPDNYGLDVLKLWCFVTDGNVTRIQFPDNSAEGIILFRRAANLIEACLPVLAELADLGAPATRKIFRRISSILVNILDNRFVCFEAFRLYGDPAIDNIINHVISVFAGFSVMEVLQYPSLGLALWKCIRVISVRHLPHCETGTISFILGVIETGLHHFTQNIVDCSLETLKPFLSFVVDGSFKGFMSTWHDEMQRISLLSWQVVLNGESVGILQHASLWKDLCILDPDVCSLVRTNVNNLIPEEAKEVIDGHFANLIEHAASPDRPVLGFSCELDEIRKLVRVLGIRINL
jgi:hypothetical protein